MDYSVFFTRAFSCNRLPGGPQVQAIPQGKIDAASGKMFPPPPPPVVDQPPQTPDGGDIKKNQRS